MSEPVCPIVVTGSALPNAALMHITTSGRTSGGAQGRRPTFHDLRHTFATIAMASSVDIKTVSVLLGHAAPAMTLRVYADSLEDSKRAGMERLDGIL